MKIIVVFLGVLLSFCMAFNQYDSSSSMKQRIKERQVLHFDEIPIELLNNLNKVGVDSNSILNDYEAKYLSFIFRIDTNEINLAGAKVGFIGSKIRFFADEKDRFYRGDESGVACSSLYIFNTNQKKESGGYDAAITYWSKILIPIEDVVKRLKSKK